jgi:hypothetical protein
LHAPHGVFLRPSCHRPRKPSSPVDSSTSGANDTSWPRILDGGQAVASPPCESTPALIRCEARMGGIVPGLLPVLTLPVARSRFR